MSLNKNVIFLENHNDEGMIALNEVQKKEIIKKRTLSVMDNMIDEIENGTFQTMWSCP